MKLYKIIIILFSVILSVSAVFAQNQKAPNFSLKDLDGKTVQLSDYKGKVVFIDFWAVWCPPCKASIPSVISLHNKFLNNKSIVVLSVNLGDSKSKIEEFVKKEGMNYPVLLDDKGIAAKDYQISSIPTFIIVDQNGNIAKRYIGYIRGFSQEWIKQLEILTNKGK
jgi:thiol-disulfide isomerase/thioredoxin